MAKYDPLRDHLQLLQVDHVLLSFDEVAGLVGGLPQSAFDHQAWWSNSRSHPNAVAWLDAGWEVAGHDLRRRRVTFRRVGPPGATATSKPAPRKRRTRATLGRAQRIDAVIKDFAHLLDYYDQTLPFDKSGQYAHHRKTIDLRTAAGSAAAAIADDRYLQSLYATLQAWGIGTRASRLIPFERFAAELDRWSPSLIELDGIHMDAAGLDVASVGQNLWQLVSSVEIVENKARIVALSKTIHHLLPDLLPPIDRMYTQEFFGFHSPEFQYEQERVFTEIWRHFVGIANAVEPSQYVGAGWRTSRSKVIDNAIVAYGHRESRGAVMGFNELHRQI